MWHLHLIQLEMWNAKPGWVGGKFQSRKSDMPPEGRGTGVFFRGSGGLGILVSVDELEARYSEAAAFSWASLRGRRRERRRGHRRERRRESSLDT